MRLTAPLLGCLLLALASGCRGESPVQPAAPASPATPPPLRLRVVAANLTSGNHQSYSPDNGNHSNPEGAGARILRALDPDLVALQEFNTSVDARQWINATFGESFSFYQEPNAQIPNGIVSRYPIIASGEWDDPVMTNREFAWAKIALPGGPPLWVVSVHLYSKKADGREKQAAALIEFLKKNVPAGDFVVLAGDFNTRSRDEPCVKRLAARFDTAEPYPKDPYGDEDTNFKRSSPYDWVLTSPSLDALETDVKFAEHEYPDGLVFDTRDFKIIGPTPPAQPDDSAAPQMQHMAVVRDFLIPVFPDAPDPPTELRIAH